MQSYVGQDLEGLDYVCSVGRTQQGCVTVNSAATFIKSKLGVKDVNDITDNKMPTCRNFLPQLVQVTRGKLTFRSK